MALQAIRYYEAGYWDRYLTCLICGSDIADYNPRFISSRKDWVRLKRRRRWRSTIVPAKEIEEDDFASNPQDSPGPPDKRILPLRNWLRLVLPALPLRSGDENRARIAGIILKTDCWNVHYYMANIMGHDENREAGQRIGYPVHAHCWKLANQIIGPGMVKPNLAVLVQSIESFWQNNFANWKFRPGTCALKHDQRPRRRRVQKHEWGTARFHGPAMVNEPEGLLRIRDLEAVATRYIVTNQPHRQPTPSLASSYTNIPVDIAMNIMDMVLGDSRPGYVQEQSIRDARNTLAAFQWKLPDEFWIARTMEAQSMLLIGNGGARDDLVNLDWNRFGPAYYSLTRRPHWLEKSGSNHLARVLGILDQVERIFNEAIAKENAA
ncbi:hypothetical protein BJY04DRAFT_217385 [Aspergillus karnatakaensis]|uniref:uncharacterized protein n=1 Tax=Aspergillus karnatakaensis TaxID=1810916 RepID=UPI003CCD8FB6